MTAKQKPAKTSPQPEFCPYLGLRDDSDVHMAFTSPLNYCHRGRSPAPVKLDHQGSHCLDLDYQTCPVYAHGAGKSFPRKLRGRGAKSSDYVYPVVTKNTWIPWLFLIIALIFIGIGYWLMRGELTLIAVASPTPFQTPLASTTPVPASIIQMASLSPTSISVSNTSDSAQISTITPFPSLTHTPAHTLTFTATPLQVATSVSYTPTESSEHALETPIGTVQKYVIHQVAGGENLTALAGRYKTSIDAIMMVNITLKVPIREGSVVIMPLNITNPDGLPALEPYQVEHDQIIVEAQAAELKADPSLLKYFNLLEDGEKLRKGDWILVPRVRPEAP